jgi:hypothetical protein
MATIGKNNEASRAKHLIAGANKRFPNASQTLTVGGATYTVTALTTLFQRLVDLREAADLAKTAAKTKVAAEAAEAPPLRGVVSAFVAYVKATYGNSPDTLADFGLSPRKATTPLTAEQKAVAVAKRAATRAARHTTGSKQKKAITGSVKVTVTTTSLAAPQPVVTPPAPSEAGPGGGPTPHT